VVSLGGALPPHDSITERVFFAVAVFVRDLPAPRAFCIVWCDNRRHRAFRVLAAPDGVSLLPSRSELPVTFHTIKAPSTTICTWSYVSDVSYYVGVTERGRYVAVRRATPCLPNGIKSAHVERIAEDVQSVSASLAAPIGTLVPTTYSSNVR